MLEYLFGTTIIEKILFYLLVKRKCYPTQLKEIFQSPLYSFQRALGRLEKGGVIVSHREGKTLVYQFNPRYPFLQELLAFLQKTHSPHWLLYHFQLDFFTKTRYFCEKWNSQHAFKC